MFPGEEFRFRLVLKLAYKRDGSQNVPIEMRTFLDWNDDKRNVTEAIKRAQLYLLSEISLDTAVNSDFGELKNKAESDPNKLLFSRNTICLDIQGPGYAHLIFTDLPVGNRLVQQTVMTSITHI
jgi:hypothetical protein